MPAIPSDIRSQRAESATWFKLAEDIDAVLMKAAAEAMTKTAGSTNWAPEAVAVRILLRSCKTFQAVILLTERGMVAEGRTLVRSLVENAFGVGALLEDADTFLKMLRDDSEASRRNQGSFILAEKLTQSSVDHGRLQKAIDAIDKKASIMSPKKVAKLGPLLKEYLTYQRLSDDAAHLSAKSLQHHVTIALDRSGWCYRWDDGNSDENAATLHDAIRMALFIGIGITQLIDDTQNNAAFQPLISRFQAMPTVPPI